MITLAGYTYVPNKACFVCQHVVDGAPVMGFAHDEDGDLQIACSAEIHSGEDWHMMCVGHLDLNHLQLVSLPTVDMGYAAERQDVTEEWMVVSLQQEDGT